MLKKIKIDHPILLNFEQIFPPIKTYETKNSMITVLIKSISNGVGVKTAFDDLFPTHVASFRPFYVFQLINLIQKGSRWVPSKDSGCEIIRNDARLLFLVDSMLVEGEKKGKRLLTVVG